MSKIANKSQTTPENRVLVVNRLKRLEGQVRGLQKMVEEGRECREILTLLAGIKSALEATGDVIFEAYLEECQSSLNRDKADTKAIAEAVRLLRR